MLRRHTQTLYPHPEQHHGEQDDYDDDDVNWAAVGARAYASPPQVSTPISSTRTSRSSKSRSSTLQPPHSTNSTAPQYSKLYSQFVRRYRSTGLESDDPRNDPDSHYFQRGLGQLNDAGDNSDDEETARASFVVAPEQGIDRVSALLEQEPIQPASQQEKERLERIQRECE